MDFFKSVFSEDPSPSSSPKSDQNSETDQSSRSSSQTQNPNPKIPSIANAWTFGSSLFKTIATKSESVIENYRRDLEEFSSGLRKETDVIRQSASRAVKDLPARLESGAAVAQTSLETVGQAIDTLGSTVSEIIIHGKDTIFSADDDDESDEELLERNSSNHGENVKPYSRLDAVIRAAQCDMKTYCEEPEEIGDFSEWKMGFVLDEKSGEIEELLQENGVIGEIYNEVVSARVDHETFWSRYFYRVYKIKKAEEARAKLVKRAIEGQEEEELSWDVDDEEDEDNGFKTREDLKKEIEENINRVENLNLGDKNKELELERRVDEVKSDDGGNDEKGALERGLDENELNTEKFEGSLSDDKVSSEGRNDNISDFSMVSSQPSSREEEDLGWDEIEDIGSGEEDSKGVPRSSTNSTDLRKRLSTAEDDEDLTWDIEDDDEEPVKS